MASDQHELKLVFPALMLALALAALDQNIVGTALPLIVSDLGGLSHISWVVTAFLLASTATTPLYGKLSDLFGRRPLFLAAISIFLLGSVLCGLAQSMLELILFRGIQGLGAGGLMTLAQTTIADLIPPRERGRYQGIFGAVFAACSVAGPLLGGLITDALSWRWVFYVNLPVGAAALALIWIGLKPRPHDRRPSIDYAGATLLTGATSCILLVLSWGGSLYPWYSQVILGLAASTVFLILGLIWREQRAAEPILAPRLFRNRVFQIGASVISLNAAALFGAMIFLPLFFQLVMGQTPSRSGLLMAPLMGGVILSSVVSGRIVSRTGRYKLLTIGGLAVACASLLWLAWCARHAQQPGQMVIGLVTLGMSLGLVMPNLTVAIQNAVEMRDLGSATSSSAYFRSLGGSVGAAIAGALLNLGLARSFTAGGVDLGILDRGIAEMLKLPAAQFQVVMQGYREAIGSNLEACAAVAALACALTWFLPELPLRGADPARTGE
ncbi:MFS transporter [bacterium]|nr:MFS transporter [bacterium]